MPLSNMSQNIAVSRKHLQLRLLTSFEKESLDKLKKELKMQKQFYDKHLIAWQEEEINA